ncbi:DUF6691 family protein [Acinetobacter faecalis]|uniref:DUF6691 family protein n=1 Tax=Acinetobacter faecalis TaxID=2665161 RepID=UPI002A9169E2|nr:DUF6691 family protein [Acinetobacter faecalis]MDY6456917.1 DUF6691 family protein [Acinetobacter faecalis]
MKNFLAFIFGGIFSLGLMISGMANPQKVLDFLDLFGQWDASLAFVMMGAICIAFIPFQNAVKQSSPKTLFNETIQLPQNTQIDRSLILGSIIFGIGWGIAGICPAPSLTLIGLGHYEGLYFIISMILGFYIHKLIFQKNS